MGGIQRYKRARDCPLWDDDDGDLCKYSDVEESNQLHMAKGCVLAAAEVCRSFDQPVIARVIIESAGVTDEELEQCADYDLEALREAGLTEVKSDL